MDVDSVTNQITDPLKISNLSFLLSFWVKIILCSRLWKSFGPVKLQDVTLVTDWWFKQSVPFRLHVRERISARCVQCVNFFICCGCEWMYVCVKIAKVCVHFYQIMKLSSMLIKALKNLFSFFSPCISSCFRALVKCQRFWCIDKAYTCCVWEKVLYVLSSANLLSLMMLWKWIKHVVFKTSASVLWLCVMWMRSGSEPMCVLKTTTIKHSIHVIAQSYCWRHLISSITLHQWDLSSIDLQIFCLTFSSIYKIITLIYLHRSINLLQIPSKAQQICSAFCTPSLTHTHTYKIKHAHTYITASTRTL